MKTSAISCFWIPVMVFALVHRPGTLLASPGEDQMGLTLEQVLEGPLSSAPALRLAGTQLLEARSRLVDAQALSHENPVVEAQAGPRLGNPQSLVVGGSLAVPVELGGQRSNRVRAAEAGLASEEHRLEAVRQRSKGMALAAFYQVLHAEGRLALAETRQGLAEDFHRTVQERHQAGDAALLEVTLAELELSRARSERLAEQGLLGRARAELAAVLGLPVGVRVSGKLEDRSRLEALLSGSSDKVRPDLLAAASDVKRATFEASVAEATRLPRVAFRLSFEREEETDTYLGGISITLPLFDQGKGPRLQAEADRVRSQLELETIQSAADLEVQGARVAYASATAALYELEAHAMQHIAASENMSSESYHSGKIDISTLIIFRRELLETRRELIDRQLEAALIGIECAIASGALP